MNCKTEDCGRLLAPHSKSEFCPKCREAIKRERRERIADLPWYIFDRDDPTVAGGNALRIQLKPVHAPFRMSMSRKRYVE